MYIVLLVIIPILGRNADASAMKVVLHGDINGQGCISLFNRFTFSENDLILTLAGSINFMDYKMFKELISVLF